jgi:hypothetical protein
MRPARGFTFVETLVALCILTTGAAVMVAPLYKYAQRTDGVSAVQLRNGVLAGQVGRLTALPFDSLASRAGCASIATGPLPHIRCVSLSSITARQMRVTLIITPISSWAAPDTAVFDRTPVSASNPFST